MTRIAMSLLALLVVLTAAETARATDVPTLGLTVGAGLEAGYDTTVIRDEGGGHTGPHALMLNALGNFGQVAVGGVAGLGVGKGRGVRGLAGLRAGWQPRYGAFRFQLLGEGGIHVINDPGQGVLIVPTAPETVSGPYVGFALGVTRPFVSRGRFEWGLALVGRHDLFTETMVRPESSFLGDVQPGAVYQVGGTMIGATLTLGFRFGDAGV